MSDDPAIVVRYKVGGMEKQVNNVNMIELRDSLAAFDNDVEVVNTVLNTATPYNALEVDRTTNKPAPNDVYDVWISAMMLKPVLSLTDTNVCDAAMQKDFWKSRTPAASVICLLQSMVNVAKADILKKDGEDREELLGGKAELVALLTSKAGDIKKEEVDAWQKNWDEQHPPALQVV